MRAVLENPRFPRRHPAGRTCFVRLAVPPVVVAVVLLLRIRKTT